MARRFTDNFCSYVSVVGTEALLREKHQVLDIPGYRCHWLWGSMAIPGIQLLRAPATTAAAVTTTTASAAGRGSDGRKTCCHDLYLSEYSHCDYTRNNPGRIQIPQQWLLKARTKPKLPSPATSLMSPGMRNMNA